MQPHQHLHCVHAVDFAASPDPPLCAMYSTADLSHLQQIAANLWHSLLWQEVCVALSLQPSQSSNIIIKFKIAFKIRNVTVHWQRCSPSVLFQPHTTLHTQIHLEFLGWVLRCLDPYFCLVFPQSDTSVRCHTCLERKHLTHCPHSWFLTSTSSLNIGLPLMHKGDSSCYHLPQSLGKTTLFNVTYFTEDRNLEQCCTVLPWKPDRLKI